MRKSKVTLPPQSVGSVRQHSEELPASYWGRRGGGDWGRTEGETTDGAETDSITASSAPVLPAANPNN